MSTPLVSVLIDTYNHERFIEEAIASVLAQDFPASDREILVVDDGSTDRTPEILRKFEPQIRVLRKSNGGQASAFNHGIPECRGEIVAFLDGDDWWAPNKLSAVVAAFAANPDVGIVGHGIVNVYRNGSEETNTLREGFFLQANTMEGARLFRRRGAFLGTSRMTIRGKLLKRIGPVPKEIEIQADEYLFTLASVLAVAQILPEALTYYRFHDANLYSLESGDPQKLRRKQQCLAAVAGSLSRELERLGVDRPVRRVLLQFTQACADHLRLRLDGGKPWETAATEWKLYTVGHPDAPISHRLFKMLTILVALVMPPQRFFRMQQTIAQNRAYQRARQRWLPIPRMEHIDRHRRLRP